MGLIASGTTYAKNACTENIHRMDCAEREEQTAANRSPAKTTQEGIYSAVTASMQGRAPPPHLRTETHLNTFGSLAEVELDGRGEGLSRIFKLLMLRVQRHRTNVMMTSRNCTLQEVMF